MPVNTEPYTHERSKKKKNALTPDRETVTDQLLPPEALVQEQEGSKRLCEWQMVNGKW